MVSNIFHCDKIKTMKKISILLIILILSSIVYIKIKDSGDIVSNEDFYTNNIFPESGYVNNEIKEDTLSQNDPNLIIERTDSLDKKYTEEKKMVISNNIPKDNVVIKEIPDQNYVYKQEVSNSYLNLSDSSNIEINNSYPISKELDSSLMINTDSISSNSLTLFENNSSLINSTGLTGAYFGGKVISSVPCPCSDNTLVIIQDLVTKSPLPLIYQPGISKLYSQYNLFTPGNNVVGSYTPGLGICLAGGICALVPTAGTINSLPGVGTSATPGL